MFSVQSVPTSGPRAPVALLAVDLDGTLLNSEWKVTARTASALELADASGTRIAVVTGRRYSVAQRLTSTLTCPHYLVTNAGTWLATSEGEVLASTSWEPDLLVQFLEHLGPLRGHAFLITDSPGRGEIICGEPNMEDPHVAHYVERNAEWLLKKNFDKSDGTTVLQVVCCGTTSHVKAVRKRAARFARIDELSLCRTEYPHRDLELVDVVARNADKGGGLRRLAEILAVDTTEIMAIGDNYADVTMLELARYPIVMANAPSELRQQWPSTASNDEDGVAHVIETMLAS